MVSSEEDLQQVQMPVTLVLVACFILFPVIQRAPNSPLAVALTMIPFFSPILMVFRITVQTPPFWQIALSLAICVATTVGVIQVSARIYRVGILMYGKRPSLVEVAPLAAVYVAWQSSDFPILEGHPMPGARRWAATWCAYAF